jgi:hypothetical protein
MSIWECRHRLGSQPIEFYDLAAGGQIMFT